MVEFRPKQRAANEYNNGKKYINEIDSPNADDFNGVIESQLWVQSLAQNTPDSSEANRVGTPSVLIVVDSNGTPLFKFKNLKGEKGDKGDKGQAVVTASKLIDEDLDSIYGEDKVGWYYADGNNTCSNLPPLESMLFDGFSLSVESMGTRKYQATDTRYIQTFRTFEDETPIIYTRSQKWSFNGVAYYFDGWTEWTPEVYTSRHSYNVLTNENLDDIAGNGTFGEWYYAENGNSCTGLPTDTKKGEQFNLEIIFTGGCRTQKLTVGDSTWVRGFIRSSLGIGNVWGKWQRIITTKDTYVKVYEKSDFKRVSSLDDKYYIEILPTQHNLTNPYVEKAVLMNASDDDETSVFNTPVVVGEKVLTNGTVKVYVTIDLSTFTNYNIKVYLKGD